MSGDDRELQMLTRAECLELLLAHDFGRVALVADGQPLVFPVNYGMEHEVVVFRTGPGTKLRWAPMRKVAFEIDEIDHDRGVAWSVLVKGMALNVDRAAGGYGHARERAASVGLTREGSTRPRPSPEPQVSPF